jgi:hypothetical protein
MPDNKPNSKYALLLTLTWGDVPKVARYTSWSRDLVLGADTFLSETSIEYSPGVIDGGIEEKPWRVKMAKRHPLDKMVRPYRHAPVQCRIEECDPYGTYRETLYYGQIVATTNNKGRNPLLVEFSVASSKSRIGFKLGVIAMNTCWNIFGRSPCCKNLGPLIQTEVITEIVGDQILVVPTLAMPLDGHLELWSSGSVRFDGLEIEIQSAYSQTEILLAERPPPEWLTQSAIFTPGCDGRLDTCRLWENEKRFNGIGLAMPDYNPNLGSKV